MIDSGSVAAAVSPSFMLSRPFFFVTNMQRGLKCCARAIVRYGPELSAVRLYDRTTDRQPHPHSFRFCRKESLEKMIETLGLQPNPGVLHRDEHFIGFMLTGPNEQIPRSVRDCAHSFDAVHHQIQDHL